MQVGGKGGVVGWGVRAHEKLKNVKGIYLKSFLSQVSLGACSEEVHAISSESHFGSISCK